MAKIQTRRTISFASPLYKRIVEEARHDGITIAQWIAQLCVKEMRRRGRPFAMKLKHHKTEHVQRMLKGREHSKAIEAEAIRIARG